MSQTITRLARAIDRARTRLFRSPGEPRGFRNRLQAENRPGPDGMSAGQSSTWLAAGLVGATLAGDGDRQHDGDSGSDGFGGGDSNGFGGIGDGGGFDGGGFGGGEGGGFSGS